MPKKKKKRKKLPDAALFGKGKSADPLELIAPAFGRAARGVKRMAKKRITRKRKKATTRKKGRRNPCPNPLRGPIIGEKLVAVEYEGGDGDKERDVIYRHDFKGLGAKVVGLKDGSVLLKRGIKPLWRMLE